MPLYLDDDFLDTFVYEEVAVALWAIRLHVHDVAVTPALALRLIKQYLMPLLDPEHWHLLHKQRRATWDGIWMICAELGFLMGRSNDPLLADLRIAVEVIHSHTTLPPRTFTFPTVIEVTYFISMCNQLRMPVQSQIRTEDGQKIDPFTFCTLCWRHPLPGRKLCAEHAPGPPLQVGEEGKRAAAARYKSGMRQRGHFDKAVNRILSREVTEFHEGLFTPVVLFPERGIAEWLSQRRPNLWQWLEKQQHVFSDENAVEALLALLHKPDGLTPKAQHCYHRINLYLQDHPQMIWPMLIRAEGWLQSRQDIQESWGGKRPGVGRHKKIRQDQSDFSDR